MSSRFSGHGRRPIAAGLTVVGLLILGAAALVTDAGASSAAPHVVQIQRAALAPVGGRALGAPAAGAAQSGYVVIKPRDPSALSAFLSAVDSRTSRQYHQYLAAGQFAGRFGPTQATIDAVESQLTRDGLTVKGVSSNGMLVQFSGTTAKVDSAFSTTLERYTTATGITGEEATSAVKLPSTIASDVSAVVGLNTILHPETDLTRAPKSAYAGRTAAKTADITNYPAGAPDPTCSGATGAASTYGGLTDDQIANAYGAFGEYATGDTGQGVHIGVYELEPFLESDLQTFDQCYFGTSEGTSMASAVNVVNVDGGPGTGSGSGEAILDIEDVSAMAPGASIDVYQAPNSTAGGFDAYAEMVDADTDKIITSSWGECEQDLEQYEPGVQQSEEYLFEQAAAQGQTVLSAAGDTGDDTCNEIRATPPPTDQNPLSVDDPSGQPYVLAVGGTTIQDADPTDFDETVWNDGADWGGGGGGLSATWAAPSWQQEVPGFPVPGGSDYTAADDVESNAEALGISDQDWSPGFCANDTTAGFTSATPCRALPDVSAQADEFTGAVTIYQASGGGWSPVGGTSSATPIWAGLLALVDASPACASAGVTPAAGIGFANPLLYAVAGNPTEYADSFHDITVGNNDVYGFDDGKVFPATTGYDLASGLGSPNLTNADGTPGLADDLCALAGTASSAPAITALSPTAASVTGGGTLIITGTGFAPRGGVKVASVTIGSATVPAADVTVNGAGTQLRLTLPAATQTLAEGTTTTTDPTTGVTYASGGSTGAQDGAGPANIVVTLSNGQSTKLNSTTEFSYVDETGSTTTPSVSSVFPFAGLESSPAKITVYGSGFASGDTVKVGGEPATVDSVVSSHELKITPPKLVSGTNNQGGTTTGDGTDCVTAAAITAETAALDPNGVGDTDPVADDICQTDIVVSAGTDSSTTDAPLPAYEGPALSTDQDGVPEVPSGYEIAPQPTEFDYYPTPTITSVSTLTTAPASLADASGGTIIEIQGTGLNLQTLNWFDVGDPTLASSEDYDEMFSTGTTDYLVLPSDPNVASGDTVGPEPDTVPIAAYTVAATSAAGPKVTYAGIPVISAVDTGTTDPITGDPVGPDAGGTALTIDGQGFSDVTGALVFQDAEPIADPPNPPIYLSNATQYTYTVASDTEIDTQTLAENPAILDTTACTESGCSLPVATDQLIEYPPGDPTISGIDVSSGPADGGTTVTITGENLGCVTSVDFGSMPALSAENAPQLLDCGSTGTVTVVAPAGTVGTSVPITLTTVESDVDNPAVTATSPTEFTYTANPTINALDYGSVDVGSSNAKTVTITNPGTAPVTLGSTDADGNPIAATVIGDDPSEFTITSDLCSGTTLGAGDSCTIGVEFTPTASGTQDAVLDLPFNQSPTDLTAALSGTGTIPADTVTSTLTTPGPTVAAPATTVTTPGPTVTSPPHVYLVFWEIVCEATPEYRYETVKVRVKVKDKTETKVERKKVKYKTAQVCHTKKLTTTEVDIARARGHFRTEAAAAKAAHAASTPDKKRKLKRKRKK